MFIITVSISYIWVYKVAIDGVKEYQQGLNDTSNKMRFVANIYAIDLIKDNKEELIFMDMIMILKIFLVYMIMK